MKQSLKAILLALTIATIFASSISHSSEHHHSWRINAMAVTGVNDLCGSPIWDFPINYTFLGEYDETEGAIDALPLNELNCQNDDIILATTTDSNFLADFGAPSDASELNKNIPINEVAVIVGGDSHRSQVPFRQDTVLSPSITNGHSATPTTLGDWMEAKGTARLTCKRNGTAKFSARFHNLIPNGVYTMWEIWSTENNLGDTAIAAVPLGGVPNVLAADPHGRAKYSRILSGCPKTEILQNGDVMRFIDVVYHSDGNVSGGVPGLGGTVSRFVDAEGNDYTSTLPVGTISHTHLIFPINVDKL